MKVCGKLRAKGHKFSAVLAVFATLGAGCASLVSGSSQKVRINSEPAGANARIEAQNVTTPGVATLKRDRNYTVYISKEGYEEQKVYLNMEMNPWVWGNFSLVGMIIDMSTGAANRLAPQEINVRLNKVPAGVSVPISSPAPPPVDSSA